MAFTPGYQNTRSNGTTVVTCVSAPASGVRVLKNLIVYNNDTITHTFVAYRKVGGNSYAIGGGTVTTLSFMTIDDLVVLDSSASITLVLGEVKVTTDCDLTANFADET